MPTLTPQQHKKVRAMLDARTIDADKAIFPSPCLDPAVCPEAMNEVREEIAKVFYPLIGRFVSGEIVDMPAALPSVVRSSEHYSRPAKSGHRRFSHGAMILPDVPLRMKEAAGRIKEWMKPNA